ncbi:hypothetical protein [[Mycobacterium] holstebronense]|uniref:Lipoprotein n=1 Tax=[Mycobacterium] holstebronense TaxID=3064288 RepID=A0ABM9LZE0_9MYCO|nr:hypothetical protein [Mycolicibacter sp. MU0102]CAJ1507390.1 hypothetical protein MU0102_003057 [Mycolicibacter sp. MU0102]
MKSDWSSKIQAAATVVGVVIAGIALLYSCDANKTAKEVAGQDYGKLALSSGAIILWEPENDRWMYYWASRDDAEPVVQIPADKWANSPQRYITTKMYNNGKRDAYITTYLLPTSKDKYPYIDYYPQVSQECAFTMSNSWTLCPDVLPPGGGGLLQILIPDDYVQQTSSEFRADGTMICVMLGTSEDKCLTVRVAIPG